MKSPDLIKRLELMRQEVKAVAQSADATGDTKTRTLAASIDALTFIMIGLVEKAADNDVAETEIMCGDGACIRPDHDPRHFDGAVHW